MEFSNRYLLFFGIVALIIWMMEYLNIFKTPQLNVPGKYSEGKKIFNLRVLLFFLGIVSWGFISFSLMGPRMPLKYEKSRIDANDIFFVVDISRSMLAEDFKPNRLEAAKKKILEFIKLMPTDRIGIIIFGEKAFTLLPLTMDLKLVSQMVTEVKAGFLGNGTNIGDALGLATAREARSIARNKIVILLTDGVSNVGNMTPLQSAKEARKQLVKVYTIGIGGGKDAKLPMGRNLYGKIYQNIPGGSIDIKTLQDIARITHAKSYIARDIHALKRVFKEIQELEKSKIEISTRIIYSELYLKYLLIGVFLLLLVEYARRNILREMI